MSNQTKHTPGPWFVRYEEPREPELVDAQGRRVSGVRLWEDDAVAESDLVTPRANTRLIAAAPDLLAAAEGILSFARRHASRTEDIHEWDALRAAIAKATGSQP